MSVRTELQEVIEWISDLAADESPAPASETPSRTEWRNLKANLDDVADDLRGACATLGDSPLAELARDLSHEAEGLALRANVLARRAPAEAPRPPKSRKEPAEPPPPGAPQPPKPPAPSQDSPPKPPTPPKTPAAADQVRAASRTIETANEKFEDLQHPDQATREFENDLDLLAEMTLSLRQRIVETSS